MGNSGRIMKKMTQSLLDGNNHLYLMTKITHIADIYKLELWGFAPLNPGCLTQENLYYLFCTNEGANERSTLSMSCYLALNYGNYSSQCLFYFNLTCVVCSKFLDWRFGIGV